MDKYVGVLRQIAAILVSVALLVLCMKGAIYSDKELEHSTNWISTFSFRILFWLCIVVSCFLSRLLILIFHACYNYYIDDFKEFWGKQKVKLRCFKSTRSEYVCDPFLSESHYKAWQQRNKIWFVIEQLHLEQRQKYNSNRESENTTTFVKRLFCCSSKNKADKTDFPKKGETSYNLPTNVILMPESFLKEDVKTSTPEVV